MIFKVVTLFLAFILLVGMIGKFIAPRRPRGSEPAIEAARKCPECGSYVIGAAPAPCDRDTCPHR
jgi:hypothetical protein